MHGRAELSERLELRSAGDPFTLEEGDAALVLAFDLGAWVEALDLASLTAGTDGSIMVAKDTGDDAIEKALERFEEAVKESARLVRDGDGDAELDDDEEDEPIAD